MMPTRACAVFSLGLAAFIGSAPVIAQSGKATPPVIQSQDTNVTGVVAELTECKRKDGVLTVKVRLHNTSSAKVDFKVIEGRNYAKFYVTAENKKYFILTDSEKAPLTTQADMFGGLDASITPGGSYQWWAKYPAPPPSVKTLTLYTPWTPSFDDVPITGE
jgi:hypothetical protein